MEHTTGIAPTEPLVLHASPTDPNDERIHALVDRIETTLLADTPRTEFDTRFRAYLRHLVYIAVTSEDEYTLADLITIIDDDEQYAQFWARLDDDEIEGTVETFGDLSPRLQTRVCDILDPDAGSIRLI